MTSRKTVAGSGISSGNRASKSVKRGLSVGAASKKVASKKSKKTFAKSGTRAASSLNEADVMLQIKGTLQYLERTGVVVWWSRFNTGSGKLTRGHGSKKPTSQWVKFGFKGCPDILGQLKGGRLLAIEVKSPRGKPSPEQAAFLKRVVDGGGVGCVARCPDDVLEAINGQKTA